MAHDGQDPSFHVTVLVDDLLKVTAAAVPPVEALLETAKARVRAKVSENGRVSGALIEQHQTAAHGLAWLATYAQSLRQMQKWAETLNAEGNFGETEQLIHQIAFGEYLWQIYGGIQMNQGEMLRLQDLGLDQSEMRGLMEPAVMTLTQSGNTQAARTRLAELMQEQSANTTVGASGLDEELEMIRDQFRRYAAEKVEPFAHEWHLKDRARTRAVKDGENYSITGNKTWITHATRTNVMTLLARTDPDTTDYRGLSMFLAEKTPGTDENPFPTEGMTGGEIEVLGYRGMKEYELGFDGFEVKGENLLGGEEGKGFKQLMETFESARIQTAARAVGVAQSALDIAMQYAQDRKQFGKSLIEFPRVSGKLAMMAVEIMIARQLTYFSAFEKDEGRRCDVEAGMAKLLGARVAWAAADNGLQIHGGNGFALEYKISRVLCDARILNIFEGAAEIQAQVIARRILG